MKLTLKWGYQVGGEFFKYFVQKQVQLENEFVGMNKAKHRALTKSFADKFYENENLRKLTDSYSDLSDAQRTFRKFTNKSSPEEEEKEE